MRNWSTQGDTVASHVQLSVLFPHGTPCFYQEQSRLETLRSLLGISSRLFRLQIHIDHSAAFPAFYTVFPFLMRRESMFYLKSNSTRAGQPCRCRSESTRPNRPEPSVLFVAVSRARTISRRFQPCDRGNVRFAPSSMALYDVGSLAWRQQAFVTTSRASATDNAVCLSVNVCACE